MGQSSLSTGCGLCRIWLERAKKIKRIDACLVTVSPDQSNGIATNKLYINECKIFG